MSTDPTPPPRPLTGLRVLEMGALIAGPFCAKMLAEFGADVVKIEPPGHGDPLRKWRYRRTARPSGGSAVAQQAVDHRGPAGGRRPGDRARAGGARRHRRREFPAGHAGGVGPVLCVARSEEPGLVMVRISGYGQTGPITSGRVSADRRGDRRAAARNRPPDRPPSRVGARSATRVRTLRRHRRDVRARAPPEDGRGQSVDLALYESVFSVMESLLPEFDAFGAVRERTGRSCRASRRRRRIAAATAPTC